MPTKVSSSLEGVKLAMMGATEKAQRRRLSLYEDAIPCKKSCSSCCNRLIYITVAEAIIMYVRLLDSDIWSLAKVRAENQAKIAMKASQESWFRMNIPCPALNMKTHECSIYPVRPTPCSTHFVISNPSLCDPWSTDGGMYEPISMDDIHEEFVKSLEKQIDGYGILALKLPIPAALLLAEKIQSRKEMSVEDLTSFLLSEFSK